MKNIFTKWRSDIQTIFIMIVAIVVIMLWVYDLKGMYPFGKEIIAWGDMGEQTIPENFYYLWDMLHGKGNAFFSWKVGLGINIAGAASEQAFFSPLNLFLLLTTRDNLINFVNIMVIIKMIGIAVSMYIYLRIYQVDMRIKLAGSMIYTFSAACLIHYQIIFVMDAAFLLPLLMTGMRRLLHKKKCGFFIFMCTLSLIINIYTSFMILLFIFISGWLKIHCWTEKEDRKELTMFLAVSTILSLLFSSVIIFPVSLSIMNSARGEGLLDQFNNIVLSPQNEIDMKGCMLVGLMFPLAVIMLNGLKWKRKGKEYSYHKWICVILLVSLIIPGTELIWHGGSRVAWPVRYVFLIAFVLIDFSFSILQQNEKVFIRRIYLIEILCVLAAGMLPVKMKEAYMTSEVFSVFGNRGLCFIVYGLFLTGYIISLNYRKLALTFIGLEMVCVAIVCVPERSAGINYIFDIQTIKNETGLKPSVFERVKNQDHSFQDNYSFVMDCSSLSNFVHVIDKNLQTIFRNLGYSTVYTRLLDTGGTVFSDALLNEKYVVTKKTLPEELYIEHDFVQTERGADYYIYETKYTLPIGLIMSDIHKEAVGNVFENQNLFFRDITGLDKELIHDVTYLLKENGSDVHLSVEQKKAIYILCEEGCAGTVQIRLNNQDFLFPDYNYPSMFDNNLLELGVFEDENVTIEIEKTTDFELNKLHIGLLDLGLLDKVCEENNKRENEFLIDIHDTGLTLELFSNSGKYVFFPIPFDSGWKSIVNGSRQEVSSQFGFIAVQIENGQNHIELKYIPNGSKQGIIITFVGVGLGIAFYLFNKKYAKSRAIWFMKNAIYYVYFVLFLCLIFGMYILPGIVYSVLYLI